jgi:hypothetical protein
MRSALNRLNFYSLLGGMVAATAIVAVPSCTKIDEPIRGLGALEIVSGNNQDLLVGQTNSVALIVRAFEQDSSAAVGVTVNWTIATGGGTLSVPSSVTDATGKASVNYTPGTTTGTVFVRARAEDLSVTFTLNVISPPVGDDG